MSSTTSKFLPPHRNFRAIRMMPASAATSASAAAVVSTSTSTSTSMLFTVLTMPIVMCLLLLGCSSCVAGEYFSSIDSLQTLGNIELGLVDTFRQYFTLREKEFANYRKFIEHVKAEHSVAFKDVEEYLGNPINAFTLIKRMVVDWNHMHESIKLSQSRKTFQNLIAELHKKSPIPDENELRGAVKGLARLQKVYNISATSLADGEINGVDYGTDLNWHDCFEIATTMYDLKELNLSVSWFEVTLVLLEDHDLELDNIEIDSGISSIAEHNLDTNTYRKYKIDCYEYLALAHYDLGHIETASTYIELILSIDPNHNIKDTKSYMLSIPPKVQQITDTAMGHKWYSNYTRLCRGILIPQRVHHKLRCTLETQSNPVFFLAPLKKEELSRSPDVAMYHGLLNDEQIKKILTEAEDKMFRSRVSGNGTAGMESDVRVSQQAWLHYKSPIMKYVANIVSQITNMDFNNVEAMQVANYGIGGQYEPHYDYFGNGGVKDSVYKGDRIMTNMFYLANVEQGGYTVFPKANIYLQPVKGSMVRWYNLHHSLDEDSRTLHAGCPVLKGSKRIGNVWIHSTLQEFRRPCLLYRDNNVSKAYA